jgi:hypothetical protein
MMDFVQVRAKVVTDNTGAVFEIPVLLTGAGPLLSLVDYFLWRRHDRSVAWMRKVTQAVSLLLAYAKANSASFRNSRELFHTFSQRLYSGTVGEDGGDPSGLYWLPIRRKPAARLLACLTDFTDWLAEQQGTAPLNPSRMTSGYDEILALAASEHRRNRAFLGHTWRSPESRSGMLRARSTLPRPGVGVAFADEEAAIAFPEQHFTDLLLRGFVRRGYYPHVADPYLHLNLRDCLITLLMHGAGFRLSECFHLWVHDVQPDPTDPTLALVRIHHPTEGNSPEDWLDEQGQPIRCNRSAYLAGRYGLRPRNELLGSEAAGWKNPALDGRYFMQAFWFPTDLGRFFLKLWNLYLRQLVQIERAHPYAFVVLTGPGVGRIYSMENYKQMHRRAVERIGLAVSRLGGTIPHGHRHAYGRRLTRAGVDPVLRKKALHHKALGSQAVYTTPNMAEVTRALNAAASKLDALALEGRAVKPSLETSELLAFGFEDIDPDGLLSGPSPKLL